jgi:hypothetical protein
LQTASILGCGYTGKFLRQELLRVFPSLQIFATTRTANDLTPFDLMKADTWTNLPAQVDATFWLFPATPAEAVKAFLASKQNALGRIIVLGSTRSFLTPEGGSPITEMSPVDRNSPRVMGEELIKDAGGIAVYAAGIYGHQRNPVDWVRRGLVGPSRKLLNVIHVKDLSQILIAAATKGRPGATYLAADGAPNNWHSLCEEWTKRFGVEIFERDPTDTRVSKRIDPSATLRELRVVLEFPNIQTGVADIEEN